MPLAEYTLPAFSSLFVIVDPLATVQQRLHMAHVACLVMVAVLAGFALIGQSLFHLLGITLPAVQVSPGHWCCSWWHWTCSAPSVHRS